MKSLWRQLSEPDARLATFSFFVLTALQTLLGPMDFNLDPDTIQVGLDALVAMKLVLVAITGVAAAWALWRVRDVRQGLVTLPAVAIGVLLAFTVLGATSGVNPGAVAASIINYINLVFVLAAISVLGIRVFSLAIICGLFCTATWGLYWFYGFPETGVFREPLEHGEFMHRLGGLAHPNSIARSAVVGVLLTLFLYRTREASVLQSALLLLAFGWNVVLAKSRTALVAGILAGLALYTDKWRSRYGVTLITGAVVLGLAGVFALFVTGNEDRFVQQFVGTVAKSGNVEELTSGTGRTAIWAETARLIARRPLTGYGLNSGPFLLVGFSEATHNSLMHAALSGGVFAGLIMLGLQLWVVWNAFSSPNLILRSLCTFLFISGLAEDTVIETFPGPCTMLWYACCIVPVMTARPPQTTSSDL